jgi:heat shock protein HslJ
MRRLIPLLIAAIALPLAAMAQDIRTLSGTVTYLERMALPADAVLMVEVLAADGTVQAEARLPTEGRQVPIPFTLDLTSEAEGNLRAGLMLGAEVIWLSEPLALEADTAGDLGELVLRRHQPMGFASLFRCGDRVIRIGFSGQSLVMDTGDDRLLLQSVPAASGARYEVSGDPETYFWNRGDAAMISIGGTQLPECRLSFPMPETPYTARGNEPFWSATVEAGEMVLRRLGMEDLVLPVTETTLAEDGAIVMIAADSERALRAVMVRQPVICHDTMTGMPYPETVDLAMGDETITGCGGDAASLLTGRTWVVEDIAQTGIIDSTRVTLGFGPDGRVAGSGGCNRWFAGYDLTGETLTIGQAGSTMMACPEAIMAQEQRFFAALGEVTGFDIDETGALLLRSPDGVLITARAATDGSER